MCANQLGSFSLMLYVTLFNMNRNFKLVFGEQAETEIDFLVFFFGIERKWES